MISLTEAKTIDGLRVPKGTVINSDSIIESQLTSAGEAATLPVVLTYTWATKPNYFKTDAGTIINISNAGGAAGSLWKATPAGWVPLNGSVLLAQGWGTVSAPLATISGSTDALFAPSGGGGSLVVPASMLIAGRSMLRIGAVIHRRGANGTAIGKIHVGTGGTTSDSAVYSLSYAATDALEARPEVDVAAVNTSTITSTNWLSLGNTGSPTPIVSPSTNINLAAAMTVSLGIASANGLDSFDLIGYSVVLRSI